MDIGVISTLPRASAALVQFLPFHEQAPDGTPRVQPDLLSHHVLLREGDVSGMQSQTYRTHLSGCPSL